MRPFAALLAAAISVAGCRGERSAAAPQPPTRPNVLLVTIDTWRADRLGAGVTPAIDRIATSRLEQLVVTDTIPLREAAQKLTAPTGDGAQKLPKLKVPDFAAGPSLRGCGFERRS